MPPSGAERCVCRDRQPARHRPARGTTRGDRHADAGLSAHPQVPAAGGPVSVPGLLRFPLPVLILFIR